MTKIMKRYGLFALTFAVMFFSFFSNTQVAYSVIEQPSDGGNDAIIGAEIETPISIKNINIASGGKIGIIFFVSRLINFASIIAGIFVMWNFIEAGFIYISSVGDSGAHVKVSDKITWSIVGIIIIVSAYTVAGLIGIVFFQDPTFILNPQLEGAI